MTDRTRTASHEPSSSTELASVQRAAEPLERRAMPTARAPSVSAGDGPATGVAIQMFADAVGAGLFPMQVQLDGTGGGLSPAGVHRAAAHGLSGSGGTFPHLAAIQRSFGRHDVSNVQAHVGGVAAEGASAMGARAYAAGNSVAFASSPDLHLAAHEAAHVVQQRGGVQLSGGVGAVGDPYERHADAVADTVVRGESAEALLDQHAPARGSERTSVQRAVQMDVPAGVISAPRARRGAAPHTPAATGALEGGITIREHTFYTGRAPVGPYVFFTEGKLRGSVEIEIERGSGGEHGHREARAAEEPATTVHGGVAGTLGHGSEHGHVALEAEVEHRFCELWHGAEISGSAGGEVSQHEASIGVGLSLGHIEVGGVQVPLPSANLHVAEWSRERGFRFLVAEVVVPVFGLGFPMEIGGRHVVVQPQVEIVLRFEPNWTAIAPHLSAEVGAVAAQGAADVEAAVAAGEAAEAVEAAVAASEATTLGAAGVGALAPAVVIAAPLAFGAFMAGMFEHDIARHERIIEQSRANARTLFMYCFGYASVWCGTGDMSGMGATQGARDAHRDIAAMRAQHRDADPTALARQWGGPQAIYNAVHDIVGPQAESWLLQRTGAASYDADLIRSNIRSVRWGGELWRQLIGEVRGG